MDISRHVQLIESSNGGRRHREDLIEEAVAIRDRAFGHVITYSPKVFIPLTKFCRDVCHYCTFARPPRDGSPAFMTLEEVVEVAKKGAASSCREALFTLGDKPELRYPQVREELAKLGHTSTLGYLAEAAKAVMETGLLPHLNPGVLMKEDFETLREASVSMGMMLESTSDRLLSKGQVHHGSPDKVPAVRLATLEMAGRLNIPFTTGLLIGIGETWAERAETLIAIRSAHGRWGHVQEVIVQNFRAKPDTPMVNHPEPGLDELLTTIALARLILPEDISIQAPPNLAASIDELGRYLDAGINDWGGVSPITPDHVNPEAPWPEIAKLTEVTESRGFVCKPRLAVYPNFQSDRWLARKPMAATLALSATDGLAFTGDWHPGMLVDPPRISLSHSGPRTKMRPQFVAALDKASLKELNEDEITLLLEATGSEQSALFAKADELRREVSGDEVTFVVNRNINYTNMCYFKCGFCAFSKGPKSLNLRGEPYLISFEEIASRTVEARDRGATEVCLQGGIHPSFTGDYYVKVVNTIKDAVPDIHIHAFSPLEVWQGAETKGVSVRDFLWELKDAGLSTLPGTAAEILDDEVRAIICPDKINTQQWSEVARTAHLLDMKMSTTMMFGHADSFRSWARHLIVLRDIQKETGGFTEFVPLPFVHMGAPIFLRGKARPGPTYEECLKVHAVSRLALHPHITNIQVSWVKMGRAGSQAALGVGANDMGGTLMNESISSAAGASHGQELGVEQMKELITALGRSWAQRRTTYERVSQALV